MRRKMPAGLLEMLVIPGLKPQTILKLHTLLGVNSLEELVGCLQPGRGCRDKGPWRRARAQDPAGDRHRARRRGRLRMNQAQAVLDQTIAELKRLRPELRKITIAGDMRRAANWFPTCAL